MPANPYGGNGATGPASFESSQPPPWVGRQVGKFRIIELIGEGGIGRVFRAADEQLGRHVALKVIASGERDGGDSPRILQFLHEARSAARLEHPHVVSIYEIADVADIHYIAMELVENGSLQDVVARHGPLRPPMACRICAEAAEALFYAHRTGIIHRDVKPGNLMLTRDGLCKLADFGLALIVNPNDSPDPDKEIASAGTPLYIAPEVIRGEPASPRSDVYSLGATLFFLMTGRPPYDGEGAAEVLQKHLYDPVPDLGAARPEVPDELVDVVEHAMAKDPLERFPSAAAFAVALRRFAEPSPRQFGQAGLAPAAVPESPRRRARQRSRWRWLAPVIAMIVGALLVLLFVVLGGKIGWWGKATPAPAPSPPARTDRTATPQVFDAFDAASLLKVADGEDDDDPASVPVIVEGRVVGHGPSTRGRFFRINFLPPDSEGAFVVIYAPELDEAMRVAFPGPGGLGLIGKRIRVTGKVERFKERPQIPITSPQQVQVLD